MIQKPINYRVKCPYCGHETVISQSYADTMSDTNGYIAVWCDVDDGPGCDRLFLACIELKASVKVYSVSEAR